MLDADMNVRTSQTGRLGYHVEDEVLKVAHPFHALATVAELLRNFLELLTVTPGHARVQPLTAQLLAKLEELGAGVQFIQHVQAMRLTLLITDKADTLAYSRGKGTATGRRRKWQQGMGFFTQILHDVTSVQGKDASVQRALDDHTAHRNRHHRIAAADAVSRAHLSAAAVSKAQRGDGSRHLFQHG